jgi:integrase
MKVFKPKFSRDGKNKSVSHWYIGFTDNSRIRRRLPAFPSKQATERAATMIGELLSGNLAAHVQVWLAGIPESMRAKLVEWGIVSKRDAGAGTPGMTALSDLLTEYQDYLRVVKGDTEGYVTETAAQIDAVFAACGFTAADDIEADAVEAWLIKQRQEGKARCGEKGWSVRTVNAHIGALRGFMRWAMRKKKALRANPIDAVDTFTARETDIRRKRRALRTSEIFRLLRVTAEKNIIREGMDGTERSLLYEFAIKVGARVNAIRHLRVCDFDFEASGGPTVRLLAEHSKTHTTALQPLEPELASKVRRFIEDRSRQSEDRVFHGTYQTLTVFTAQILKEDAEVAKVAYKTDEGIIDFHALKHTFASSLRGMDDTDKQALTGHKTRDMLSRYDHRSIEDKRMLLSRVQAWGMAG